MNAQHPFIVWLRQHEACRPAQRWARTQPNVRAVITNCPHGGWLSWLLEELRQDDYALDQIDDFDVCPVCCRTTNCKCRSEARRLAKRYRPEIIARLKTQGAFAPMGAAAIRRAVAGPLIVQSDTPTHCRAAAQCSGQGGLKP